MPTKISAKEYLKWRRDIGLDIEFPSGMLLTGLYKWWLPNEFPTTEDIIACNEKESCGWWLRSPGKFRNYAAFVDLCGSIYMIGNRSFREWIGVRPALWLNLIS